MVHIGDLVSQLRTIRMACAKAINPATGEVDKNILKEQASTFDVWLESFTNLYIASANIKPIRAEEISEAGEEIVKEAWYVKSVILEVEARAGEAPAPRFPGSFLFGGSGYVRKELKTGITIALYDLEKMVEDFRTNILKT